MSSVEERSEATAASAGPLSVGGRSARSGRSSRPARSKRRRRLARTLILLVILAAGFVVVAESLSLVRHARAAQASLEAFKASLQNNDAPSAQRHLRDADASLAVARHSYDSLPLVIARDIPFLGWPVSDAGRLLTAATDVSSAGQDALGLYEQVRGSGSKLFHNDTVSLPELNTVTHNADGMVAKMDRAERQLKAVHAAFWEPSVGHARDSALRQVTSLRAQGRTAQRVLDLAPRLVGADGVRTYLVVVLNPAELEGAGGAALNMMAIRFNHGRMKILQSGSTYDITNENSPTKFAPLPNDPWLAGAPPSGLVLGAADRSPDFRTSGQELMRGYTAQFGVKLDGIVAIDPLALQGLMQQMTPFDTAGYGRITATNIVKTLLVDSYARFPILQERHVYNTELMNTLMHKILAGGHMLGKGKSLRSAAAGGHLQIYMNDSSVQREVESAQLLRTLPNAGSGDVVGAYTANTNASKVDYWQHRTIDQRVHLNPDGSADAVRTLTLMNAAPAYSGPGTDPAYGYLTRISFPMVSMDVPATSTVEALTVNGKSAHFRTVNENAVKFLVLRPRRLAPGSSMTVQLRYSLPRGFVRDGRYRVTTTAQPLLNPVRLTLTIQSANPCRAADSRWTVTGNQARWSAQEMAQLSSEVSCR